MLWEYESDPPAFCPYGDSDVQGELFCRGDLNRLVEVLNATKSQFLTKEQAKKMFSNYDKFFEMKKKWDPYETFQSNCYRRIFKDESFEDGKPGGLVYS